MRSFQIFLGCGAIALFTAGMAGAEEPDRLGPYADLRLGVSIMPNQDLTENAGRISIESDPGAVVGASLGWGLTKYARLDLTFDYRHHDLDSFVSPSLGLSAGGDLDGFSGLANFYLQYPFTVTDGVSLIPYAGAGIGFNTSKLRVTYSGTNEITGTSTQLAWAAHAGVEVPVVGNFSALVGYRYLETKTPSFDTKSPGTSTPSDVEFDAHEVTFGVRYRFGSP